MVSLRASELTLRPDPDRPMKPQLILRADAGSEIGVGHVMRCLALAQAWQDAGGEATFVWAEMPVLLGARLAQEQCVSVRMPVSVGGPEDAYETARRARRCGAQWVVVDGYRFSPGYFEQLWEHGLNVLAIDDMAHLSHYPVALLLNQNLSAHAEIYSDRLEATTPRLLGPRYSLLRREFRTAAATTRPATATPRRVLVTFGGADAENFTARTLENLSRSGRTSLDVVVLVGAANPHVEMLRALAAAAQFPCAVRVAIEDVAAVMTWADVAISAAGSTVWELASLRRPALIGAHEANQLAGLEALRRVPGFRIGTVAEMLTRDLAAELDLLPTTSGLECDAHGAERVVARMLALPAPTVTELSAV